MEQVALPLAAAGSQRSDGEESGGEEEEEETQGEGMDVDGAGPSSSQKAAKGEPHRCAGAALHAGLAGWLCSMRAPTLSPHALTRLSPFPNACCPQLQCA